MRIVALQNANIQRPAKQKGVALITVLLVFAIASVIAAEIVTRTYFGIQSTGNHLIQAQAYQYALGGEAFARQILKKDFDKDHESNESAPNDHLYEAWSRLDKAYEFDQGRLEIVISDLQARFNVNNLVNIEGGVENHFLQQFQHLLNIAGVDSQVLSSLADWLDKDSVPRGINTEDQGYLALEQGYRSANRAMAHISELRLLQGIGKVEFEKLKPFIVALPKTTSININTANAGVLSVLLDSQEPGVTRRIVDSRGEKGFESVSAFLEDENMADLNIQESDISVRSEFFMVQVRSTFAERVVWLTSVLHRDLEDGSIRLISRDKTSRFVLPNKDATRI